MDVLPSEPLPVQRASHGVDLLFKVSIMAFHDLNTGASLGLIGHGLPLKPPSLEERLETRVDLELP